MKGARKRPAKRPPEQIPFKFAESEVDHAERLRIANRRHALIRALLVFGVRHEAK
jgi:hypothetical protein